MTNILYINYIFFIEFTLSKFPETPKLRLADAINDKCGNSRRQAKSKYQCLGGRQVKI